LNGQLHATVLRCIALPLQFANSGIHAIGHGMLL
jgi:hypothetical protein